MCSARSPSLYERYLWSTGGMDVLGYFPLAKTASYGLINLRSSCEWKQLRLDVGIENLFDRFYAAPRGGA